MVFYPSIILTTIDELAPSLILLGSKEINELIAIDRVL
jgi:hypothetical protein